MKMKKMKLLLGMSSVLLMGAIFTSCEFNIKNTKKTIEQPNKTKTDTPKTDDSKKETTKNETPVADNPKNEATKNEDPKKEIPQSETPENDTPITNPTTPTTPSVEKELTEQNVKKLFENFSSKIELTGINDKDTLASSVKEQNIKIKDDHKIKDLNISYTLEPNDVFGTVFITAKVNQNGIDLTSKSETLNNKFKTNKNLVDAASNELFEEVNSILSLSDDKIKQYAAPIQNIRISIQRIKEKTFSTEKLDDIFADRVATFLLLIGWSDSASNAKIEEVRDFLNKEDSNIFSKLDYLSDAKYIVDRTSAGIINRWEYIKRLVILNKIAQNPKYKNDPKNTLISLFGEPYIKTFLVEWFEDFIEDYYNVDHNPEAKFSMLYNYVQPYRTAELYNLLKDDLSEETRQKTIKALEKFTSHSFVNYGTNQTLINDSRSVINNLFHSIHSLLASNYVDLSTQNLNNTIKNFNDYIKWVKTTDFFKKRFSSYNNYLLVKSFFLGLNSINNYYKELSKNTTQINIEKLDLSEISRFLSLYLNNQGRFDNVVGTTGHSAMEAIAQIYDVLGFNPKLQEKALETIKTKLINGKKLEEFIFYSEISEKYQKIWDTFFK